MVSIMKTTEPNYALMPCRATILEYLKIATVVIVTTGRHHGISENSDGHHATGHLSPGISGRHVTTG